MKSMDEIIAEVAERSGVSVGEMKSEAKTARVFWARAEAMSLCLEHKKLARNMGAVGRHFHRDRATVYSAITRFRKRQEISQPASSIA